MKMMFIRKISKTMKLRAIFLTSVTFFILSIVGCTEEIDDSTRYVFKEKTITDYLCSHEEYSEYCKLLGKIPVSSVSQTTPLQLLSARGHYTVFAPTNECIERYLQEWVEKGAISTPSWDAFPSEHERDSVQRIIVMNSIINSGDDDNYYDTSSFPLTSGAEFPLFNMNDKKLTVTYTENPDEILINGNSPINRQYRDIYALNGVIHQMDKVIIPEERMAEDYLKTIIKEQRNGFLVMARAIQACGLLDTLGAYNDEAYEHLYQIGAIPDLPNMTSYGFAEGGTAHAPQHRRYGFTIFAETDDFWRSQGIEPTAGNLMETLQQWIINQRQYASEDHFTTEPPYSSPENLLYQWVTYHILPMKITSDKLTIHHSEQGYSRSAPTSLSIPVHDFLCTMGQRRLLKIYESKESNGIYLNRFPNLDNARNGTYHELSCDPDKTGSRVMREDPMAILTDILNACIYPIDKPLSYDDETRHNLQTQRIRFDSMTLFPEARTNDIRKKFSTSERAQYVYIPPTSVYQYFRDMWCNDDSHIVYYNAYDYHWPNLYSDETKVVGRYELTFRMPPVPRSGIYELRYGITANDNRGIAQMYFGSNLERLVPTGIPVDLTIDTYDPRSCFHSDTQDLDYNAEIDKHMRNNGFMKGDLSDCKNGNKSEAARYDYRMLRHIITRQWMDSDKEYYLRVKSILDSDRKEFYLDYLELCAKEVFDNPAEPEDIW